MEEDYPRMKPITRMKSDGTDFFLPIREIREIRG